MMMMSLDGIGPSVVHLDLISTEISPSGGDTRAAGRQVSTGHVHFADSRFARPAGQPCFRIFPGCPFLSLMIPCDSLRRLHSLRHSLFAAGPCIKVQANALQSPSLGTCTKLSCAKLSCAHAFTHLRAHTRTHTTRRRNRAKGHTKRWSRSI